MPRRHTPSIRAGIFRWPVSAGRLAALLLAPVMIACMPGAASAEDEDGWYYDDSGLVFYQEEIEDDGEEERWGSRWLKDTALPPLPQMTVFASRISPPPACNALAEAPTFPARVQLVNSIRSSTVSTQTAPPCHATFPLNVQFVKLAPSWLPRINNAPPASPVTLPLKSQFEITVRSE